MSKYCENCKHSLELHDPLRLVCTVKGCDCGGDYDFKTEKEIRELKSINKD